MSKLAPLRRLYSAWMALGRLLGRVTTPVLLLALWVLVLLPLALVTRLLRADVLGVRYDRSARSYWIERSEPLTREGLERLS